MENEMGTMDGQKRKMIHRQIILTEEILIISYNCLSLGYSNLSNSITVF